MSDTKVAIRPAPPRSIEVAHVHVMPGRVLLAVFAALVGLTIVTVVFASFPVGSPGSLDLARHRVT